MKHLAKILSFIMVLSLVLSTFAIFSSFAETASGESAEAPGRVVIYDMDSKADDYFLTAHQAFSGPTENDSMIKHTDAYGNVYWQRKSDPENASDFMGFNFTKPVVGASNKNAIILADIYGTTGDVTDPENPLRADVESGVKIEKNTDFVVIDFDISTDTDLVPYMYFNSMYYSDTLNNDNSYRIQNNTSYLAWGGNSVESFGVGNYGGTNISSENDDLKVSVHPITDSGRKWLNVTIVYDVSGSTLPSGYAESGDWRAYVYLDGYYCGEINAAFWQIRTNAKNNHYVDPSLYVGKAFYTYRLQTPKGGTVNDTTNFANFTISKFEVGYDGMIDDDGVLGSQVVTLHNIPELQYCLEDTPDTPDNYVGTPIASIQRGEEIIPVYDVDDLHGDLLNGDVVTVYADVKALKSVYLIKNYLNEAGEDTPATVVWQDKNGVVLGETGSLYAAPKVLTAPADALWVLIVDNKTVISGNTASSSEKTDAGYINVDELYYNVRSQYKKSSREIVLFDDYTMYGLGAKGSTTTDKNYCNANTKTIYDLNGHTLNFYATTGNLCQGNGAGYTLIYKNGVMTHGSVPSNASIMAVTTTSHIGHVIYENLHFTTTAGKTTMDFRGGLVSAINSTLVMKSEIASLKSVGTGKIYGIVDGCTVTGSTVFSVAQTNKSGVGRYGSCNMFVAFRDTDYNGTGYLAECDIYANNAGNVGAAYEANKVRYQVTVVDCDINTTADMIFYNVGTIPGGSNSPNVLDIVLNQRVVDSTIKARGLVRSYIGSANTSLVQFNGNFNYENCAIDAEGISAQYTIAGGNAIFSFDEGCLFSNTSLTTNNTSKYTYYAPAAINYPDGCVLAHTSAYGDLYKHVVTSSYETYTYKLGTQDAVEFFWNVPAEGADAVNIDQVVTPANKAGAYKYSWAQDGKAFTTILDKDFALSAQANLTLWSDLYFNLYVPKSIVEGLSEYVSIVDKDGTLVEGIYVEELGAYKYQIKSVKPTDAENEVIFVKTVVNGAYGDVYESIKGFSMVDYANKVLSNDKTEDDAVIYALLNYLNAMYALKGADNSAIDALLPDDYATKAISGAAKLGTLADTTIAINCGTTLNWVITGAAGASYDVQYYMGGALVERTVTANGEGVAYVNVGTMDMLSDITVNGVEVNIQGYYNKLVENGVEAEVIKAVEAIYDLASAAIAYNK